MNFVKKELMSIEASILVHSWCKARPHEPWLSQGPVNINCQCCVTMHAIARHAMELLTKLCDLTGLASMTVIINLEECFPVHLRGCLTVVDNMAISLWLELSTMPLATFPMAGGTASK